MHSVTKYLAGHTDVVLGAAVTAGRRRCTSGCTGTGRLHGAIPGPVEAWLALRGLRTLHLRVERARANAAELARRLAGHPAVARVRHPSPAGRPRARAGAARRCAASARSSRSSWPAAPRRRRRCAAGTRLWVHATSLGRRGVDAGARRRWHAAEAAAVPESLMRLSVGVEDVEDLWADLAAVLDTLAP